MFKGTVVVLGLSIGASVPTWAQSNTTFFGTVDTGMVYSNNGVASVQAMSSGVMLPSRFGVRGMEDLGDGLKAKFTFEAGFDTNTGVSRSTGNPSSATPAAPNGVPVSGLFNRRSFIGLEGNFGSITVGRDYTPLYWGLLDTDVQRLGLLGNLQQVILLSGTGTEVFGRASNAVFYETPKLGGFLAHAMYSFGSESPGGGGRVLPKDANRMFGVQGQYTLGTLLISGSYQEAKLPMVSGTPAAFTGDSDTRQDYQVAFKYALGDYALGSGYMLVKKPTPNSDASDVWLGVSAKIGAGTAFLQEQRLRQNVALGPAKIGTVLSLSYVYPLSTRSSLYASYGQVKNSTTSTFALLSSDAAFTPGAPGVTARTLALGVRHNF